MKKTLIGLALVSMALTGCATETGEVESDPAAGSNRPADEPEATQPEAEPTEAAPTNLTFGETFTYGNGLQLTVAPPAPFTPSESAAGAEGSGTAVSFAITVVNGSEANYEPTLFNATLQSSNAEANAIFDSAQGIEGSPQTVVLPGRETMFTLAFEVVDPADLVLQAAPGFEYDAAIYTS